MDEFYRGRRVAVTGGAGFVGSHLVDALVDAGADVVAIDNLHSGELSNLRHSMADIRFIEADVRDRDMLCEILDGAEFVFHLAGNADVPYSLRHPDYDFETNMLGTFHVLQTQMAGKAGRVLFSSTAAVYGVPRYTPVDEGHPLEPISPYGGSKLAAERLGVGYARSLGIDFLVARIFNTYGPRQRKYVMYDLFNKLHSNPRYLEVLGDGKQIRDYSFVTDTVRALMTIMSKGQRGEAYNISGNNPMAIRDLAPLLAEIMGIEEPPRIMYTGQSWKGDIPIMAADVRKLYALGYQPEKAFHDGLGDLLRWLQAEVWDGHRQSEYAALHVYR